MVDIKEIKLLSVEERILMVEAIWDSIAEDSDSSDVDFLTEEQKKELDRRIDLHESGKGKTYTWDEVKARLKMSRD
jgi:putative addiction module component (TIGR02574 family)